MAEDMTCFQVWTREEGDEHGPQLLLDFKAHRGRHVWDWFIGFREHLASQEDSQPMFDNLWIRPLREQLEGPIMVGCPKYEDWKIERQNGRLILVTT